MIKRRPEVPSFVVWALTLATCLLVGLIGTGEARELTLTLGKKPVYMEPAAGAQTCAAQGGTDCGTLTAC